MKTIMVYFKVKGFGTGREEVVVKDSFSAADDMPGIAHCIANRSRLNITITSWEFLEC